VLVRPQHDLQPAVADMLSDLIGEQPRHALRRPRRPPRARC
jgi:hypothetical protein